MREGNYHFFFGLFANRLKVGIVGALMRKPLGVSKLAGLLGAERSRVSHALLEMSKCHVVEAEKKGKQRVYSLNQGTVRPILSLVDRHALKYCSQCWAKKGR